MVDTDNRKTAATALKEVVASHLTRLKTHPTTLRSLLSDFAPQLNCERFILCAPLELPRFFTAVQAGGVAQKDIDSLRQELVSHLGFDAATAAWCAQAWQQAFGLSERDSVETQFNCPNCIFPGRAEIYWANRRALCPQCNSQVSFSQSLIPSLHQQGWKKKRTTGKTWSLIGTVEATSELKSLIHSVASNDSLSDEQISDTLGLDNICRYLRPQIAKLIEHYDCRPVEQHKYHLVRAIAHAILGPPLECSCEALQFSGERWGLGSSDYIAYTNGYSGKDLIAVVFGATSIGYEKNEEVWSMPYSALKNLEVSNGARVFELQLGIRRTISVEGTGVTRRDLWKAISAVADMSDYLDRTFTPGAK